MRASRPSGLVLLSLSLVGCAGARLVETQADSGVVAIPSDSPANREKAAELIATRCPSGFTIAREWEEVVGTTSDRELQRLFDGIGERWQSRRTVRTETEWRMRYRCK